MQPDFLRFIFATIAEAKETIVRLAAHQAAPRLYLFPGGEVFISGMGPAATAASLRAIRPGRSAQKCPTTRRTLHAPATVWVNLGIAGCLGCFLPAGSQAVVRSVCLLGGESDSMHVSGFLGPAAEGCHLYTVDEPLHAIPKAAYAHSLVDMEGYAIAKEAALLGIPLGIIKLVSDHCCETSSLEIRKRLPALGKELAAIASQMVQSFSGRPGRECGRWPQLPGYGRGQ